MPERIRFTQAKIKELQPIPGKQAEIWDDEIPRFGVRVSLNSKTFFVMCRVNGRLIRATVGKFPEMNVDNARKEAMKMLVEMGKGSNPNIEKKRRRIQNTSKEGVLSEVFEGFLKVGRKTPPKKGTISAYRSSFKKLATWHRLRIDDITPEMIRAKHAEIGTTNGTYAANHAMGLLRTLYVHAIESGLCQIDKNPVDILRGRWFKESARRGVLGEDQFSAFFKAIADAPGDTCNDLFTLLLFTGLRKGDAMALRWSDIDFEKQSLHIITEKTNEPLDVPLSEYLVKILETRKTTATSQWLFPSNSRAGHVTNTQFMVDEISKRGVTIYPHLLRKTFSTLAAATGCPTVFVDILTAHIPSGVTGKNYIFPSIKQLRPFVEAISEEILRHAGIATV